MELKQFEVVAEVAKDHYYLQHSDEDQNGLMNYRRIIREWRILEKELPENIYVQTYGSRMDLLRAVIIASHDALFFFDIGLPWDYPHQPPRLHYHSHAYRLNPNLFVGGKVCISLINTDWSKASTLVDILVSIQKFVLNQKAFILCWRSMLKIMRQPPQMFEDFVFQHCRGRKVRILTGIENELNECCSPTIKADLIEIEQELKNAFATLGISLPNTIKDEASVKPRKRVIVKSNKDDPIKKPRKRVMINLPMQVQKWTRVFINFTRHIQKSVTRAIINFTSAHIQKWTGPIINFPRQIQNSVTESIINFSMQIQKWWRGPILNFTRQIQKWTWAIIDFSRQWTWDDFPLPIQKRRENKWVMIAIFMIILYIPTNAIRSETSITDRRSPRLHIHTGEDPTAVIEQHTAVIEQHIGNLTAVIGQHIENLTAGIEHVGNLTAGIEQRMTYLTAVMENLI